MSVDIAGANAAAARIRAAASLAGASATNEYVVEWQRLEAEALVELGNVPTQWVWRFTLHEDGAGHGVWSHSDLEAALSCAFWWDVPVVAVSVEPIADPIGPAQVAGEMQLW
jgi:hypothetical protein